MTFKKAQKHAQILETRVDSTTVSRVLRFVRNKLSKFDKKGSRRSKFYIVTPYSEMILAASRDLTLRKIINSADISLPDGVVTAQAVKFLSLSAPASKTLRAVVGVPQGIAVGAATFFNKKWLFSELAPVKGRELFLELVKLANKKGWRVFFLGGEHGEAKLAASKLKASYKKVKIKTDGGPMLRKSGDPKTIADIKIQKRVIGTINKFRPHLLFVAFGPPKAEKWLSKNFSKLDVGGAMMIGGTFRYISGLSKIPPTWVDNMGLESFWRLVTEPKRIGRVLNAVVVLPLKVYFSKINKN